MAKKEAADPKTNSYLLGIVGIVAIVGLVILVLNAGAGISVSSDDLSGEAVKMKAGSSMTLGNMKIMRASSGSYVILGSTPCCEGCDVEGGDCDDCKEYCD